MTTAEDPTAFGWSIPVEDPETSDVLGDVQHDLRQALNQGVISKPQPVRIEVEVPPRVVAAVMRLNKTPEQLQYIDLVGITELVTHYATDLLSKVPKLDLGPAGVALAEAQYRHWNAGVPVVDQDSYVPDGTNQ